MVELMIENAPSSSLGFAKADHSDAYKQLPLRPDQRELAATSLRGPRPGESKSFLPNTQLFGSTTAVLQYSCLSRIIATLARRLLKNPLVGYFDDFRLVAPLPLTEDALLASTDLNGIFGFVLKLPKSEWGQIIELLVIMIDLAPVPGSPPLLYLSRQRKNPNLRFRGS